MQTIVGEQGADVGGVGCRSGAVELQWWPGEQDDGREDGSGAV